MFRLEASVLEVFAATLRSKPSVSRGHNRGWVCASHTYTLPLRQPVYQLSDLKRTVNMAEASQASTSDDINIKIKTMQPATYDVKIPVQVMIRLLTSAAPAFLCWLCERGNSIYGRHPWQN